MTRTILAIDKDSNILVEVAIAGELSFADAVKRKRFPEETKMFIELHSGLFGGARVYAWETWEHEATIRHFDNLEVMYPTHRKVSSQGFSGVTAAAEKILKAREENPVWQWCVDSEAHTIIWRHYWDPDRKPLLSSYWTAMSSEDYARVSNAAESEQKTSGRTSLIFEFQQASDKREEDPPSAYEYEDTKFTNVFRPVQGLEIKVSKRPIRSAYLKFQGAPFVLYNTYKLRLVLNWLKEVNADPSVIECVGAYLKMADDAEEWAGVGPKDVLNALTILAHAEEISSQELFELMCDLPPELYDKISKIYKKVWY